MSRAWLIVGVGACVACNGPRTNGHDADTSDGNTETSNGTTDDTSTGDPDTCGNGIVDPGEWCHEEIEFSLEIDARLIAAGDLDGDTFDEIVVITPPPNRELVVVRPDAEPEVVGEVPLEGAQSPRVQIADFEGDGLPDVVVNGSAELLVFHNSGEQLSATPTVFDEPGYFPLYDVVVVDVEGDGKSEYFGFPLAGIVGSLFHEDAGELVETQTLPGLLPCKYVSSMESADLDMDDSEDVVVLALGCESGEDEDPTPVRVLMGDTDGTLALAAEYAAGSKSWTDLALGDFDGDGILDIAVANSADDTISVLVGKGNGEFAEQVIVGQGRGNALLVAGDVDAAAGDELVLLAEETLWVVPPFGTEQGVITPYSGTPSVSLKANSDTVADIALSLPTPEFTIHLGLLRSNP